MRPKKWQGDPLVTVRGERLRAALKHAGLPVAVAARLIGIDHQRLQQLASRNARCRASVLLKLARLLRVSDAWLAGRLYRLPGARITEKELLSNARTGLLGVCHRLSSLLEGIGQGKRFSSRHRELRHLRASCRGILAVFDPRHADPVRRVRELSERGKTLRAHIGAVLPLLDAPTRHRRALATHLRALQDLAQGLPYYWSEQPTRAELAEHSLRAACHELWLEQAQEDDPTFDPGQELVYDEDTGRCLGPPPWPTMFAMDRLLEVLLTPEAWRALLLRDWRDGKMPSPATEEAEEIIVALSRALRLVLEPWFRGQARLDVEGLVHMIPQIWERALTARGGSVLPAL